MNKETLSPEEFENLSKTLGLSDVEIAVAAAFADEGFEPVDCRDLAGVWRDLQYAKGCIEDREARSKLMDAGDVLMALEFIETYDYVPHYTRTMCDRQIEEWAALILTRLYGEPDEGKYSEE